MIVWYNLSVTCLIIYFLSCRIEVVHWPRIYTLWKSTQYAMQHFHNWVLNITSMEIWIDRKVYLIPWTNQEMSGQGTYSHVTRLRKRVSFPQWYFHISSGCKSDPNNGIEFLYNFRQSSIKPSRAKLLYNRVEMIYGVKKFSYELLVHHFQFQINHQLLLYSVNKTYKTCKK